MSILSTKQNIFEEISILKTASELSLKNIAVKNDIFSAFNSSKIKNNKDPFLLIVDLLTILAGSGAIQKIITEIFSSLGSVENSFKNSLKSEIMSANGGANANPPLPSNLVGGFQVHINKLDFDKELFTQQNDPSFNLYLDGFKQKLISTILSPVTEISLNSSIKASYDNNTGFFTITPLNTNQVYNQFISSLIDDIVFVDTKILLNMVMDSLFNTRGRSKSQVNLNEQMNTMLNKLITQTTEDDSYFTFTTQELNDIESKVETSDQLYTDVGCGRIAISLNTNDVANLTSGITFPASKQVIATTLGDIASTIGTNADVTGSNTQSISDNFFSSFLNTLKTIIVRLFVASPQINLIYAISQSFIQLIDNIYDPINDIIHRKALTTCMIKKLINSLLNDIFKLLEKEIIEIVGDVAELIIEESIDKYEKILKSLI